MGYQALGSIPNKSGNGIKLFSTTTLNAVESTDETFKKEVTDSKEPVIVDFYAE